MSIHVSSGRGVLRRVVLSCDLAGCPVQIEPPPIEGWRSDVDARSWARDHAVRWTFDRVRLTDYCPEHADFSTAPAADAIPPRPTSSARDQAGNPLDRDEYAAVLRTRLSGNGRPAEHSLQLTGAQAGVIARLLDELADVYRGESLGALAHDLSALVDAERDSR